MIYNFDGAIIAPNYSKSLLHRCLFASMLNRGKTTINNISWSEDILATLNVLKACGCIISTSDNQIEVDSSNLRPPTDIIDLNQCGTTMRFCIPILTFLFNEFKFSGKSSLLNRPLDSYKDFVNIDYQDNMISVSGWQDKSTYHIDGSISSQFISGMLFILPLIDEDTTLIIDNISSKNYILMTISILNFFGIDIDFNGNTITVKGNQFYKQDLVYNNEYDESSLGYLRALRFSGVDINFLENQNTYQPDHCLVDITNNQPNIIDAINCPDLVPTLVFVTQFFEHSTTIVNVDRLRYKECDRLDAILDFAKQINLDLKYQDNRIIINPNRDWQPATIDVRDDHRICLMAILFKTKVDLVINDLSVINKSYPEMYKFLTDEL